jgi:tRNA pseudouridine13 synthase
MPSPSGAALPFITPALPGLGGFLKEEPGCFVVEEMPLYPPSGEGPHLYLTLRRAGLTTRQMAEDLSRRYNVPAGEIGYAGLKDKWARVTQTFSLPLSLSGDEARALAADAPWEIISLGRHKNKLKVGHLLGNRFAIVISAPTGAFEQALAIAEALKKSGAPNYFGEQRFGKDGDNMLAGLKFLKSGRRGKSWRDKFLLSSLQSFIYNHYLASRLTGGLFARVLTGDICKKHDTGGLFASENGELETARFLAGELSHTGPIFGGKMMKPRDEAAELEMSVLKELDLTEEEIGRAGSGDRRVNRLLLPDLAVSRGDRGFAFSFSLPKGAYATSVMREFMKRP